MEQQRRFAQMRQRLLNQDARVDWRSPQTQTNLSQTAIEPKLVRSAPKGLPYGRDLALNSWS
jgi:hypothetical protein